MSTTKTSTVSNERYKKSAIMQKPKITPIRRECLSSINGYNNRNFSVKSQQLRDRYMRTLGIKHSSTENSIASRFQPRIMSVRTLKEPLKGDDSKHNRNHNTTTSISHSPKTVMSLIKEGNKIKRQVSFDNSVSVVPIPKRNAYSNRIRKRIWNSAAKIHENANRNAVEFSVENWDWRQVLEENDFLICADTGEMMHPVHVDSFIEFQTPS